MHLVRYQHVHTVNCHLSVLPRCLSDASLHAQVGMHTPDEVRANIKTAVSASKPWTQEEQDALDEINQILEPIKDFSWKVGKPENN